MASQDSLATVIQAADVLYDQVGVRLRRQIGVDFPPGHPLTVHTVLGGFDVALRWLTARGTATVLTNCEWLPLAPSAIDFIDLAMRYDALSVPMCAGTPGSL